MQRAAPAGYESDFAQWAQSQATALRAGRWADLDVESLAEEIEDLSSSNRREIRSRLKQLVAHLLKQQFQPERTTRSWMNTIIEQADEIQQVLERSPSLRREMPDFIGSAYAVARKLASNQTDLPLANFPETPTPEFERALRAALTGDDFAF